MRDSVVGHLILKDWRLNRPLIVLSVLGGLIALVIVSWGGQTPFVLGGVWFFMALILMGHMLPFGIINERKRQNLPFLMSLPISSIQYTISKLISTLGLFLIPWLMLLISAGVLIEVRHVIPLGWIPMSLILAILPFIGFVLITAAALVGEKEGWGVAANVVCSSSYWFVWYAIARIPSVAAGFNSPFPLWNSAVRNVLACEFGTIVMILALTFFFQSRKKDFI
ncbi:MAG TPA: ABC-2 transporter permease [Bryobacteraceae bacterium]|jgi:hypothetical protein|nr:ABC-2 transporter permease [Bryobacteraceae bacterium]